MSLREFYLNVVTERQTRGTLWFNFDKRNNLNVSCFDLVSSVDSVACYASDWKVYTKSYFGWKYTLALCIFVIKFVVRGIAELTSTGAVVLLVHPCK